MSSVESELRQAMDAAAGKSHGARADARSRVLAAGEAALGEVLKQASGESSAQLGGRDCQALPASSFVWQERLLAMREAPIALPAGPAYALHGVMSHLGAALEDGYNVHPVQWVAKYYATPNKHLREACLRSSATLGMCLRQHITLQCTEEVRGFTRCLQAQGVAATYDLSARAQFTPRADAPALPAAPAAGKLRRSGGGGGAGLPVTSERAAQLADELDSKWEAVLQEAGVPAQQISSASRAGAVKLARDFADDVKKMEEAAAATDAGADAEGSSVHSAAANFSARVPARTSALDSLQAKLPRVRAAAREAADRE